MFRSETPIPASIPAGESRLIELVMTNRVGGRFAQQATMYLSVDGVLIEKNIDLEGHAAPDPNPPPEQDGAANAESESST